MTDRIILASATSAPDVQALADFVADADNAIPAIKAAMAALPSGGVVYMMAGDYHVPNYSHLVVPPDVTVEDGGPDTNAWTVERLARVIVWLSNVAVAAHTPEDVADCIDWCNQQITPQELT